MNICEAIKNDSVHVNGNVYNNVEVNDKYALYVAYYNNVEVNVRNGS